jgi:hypothetical protein
MDGELSCLAVVAVVGVVVIVMVGLSQNATSVVRLGTLLVNVACGLVQEVLAVEDVAAGAGAAAAAAVPDTAGVRAILGEVTALVTALQGAVVYPQLADAAIAGHHSTTVAMMNLF